MEAPTSIRKESRASGASKSETAVYAADGFGHSKFVQTVEGWPGSGFKHKTTTLRVRRRPDRIDGADEVQIEIAIVVVYASGSSRETCSSFGLSASEAVAFIAAATTVRRIG